SEYKNPELKRVIKKSKYVHVVSQEEKRQMSKVFDVDRGKLIYIPLFLNLKLYRSSNEMLPEVMKFKNEYNLSNKKIVLFAGVRNYNKGAITLLHSMEKLYEKDKSFRLISIGPSTKEWEKEKEKIINKGFLI